MGERKEMFFQVSGSPCPVDRVPPQTFTGLWRANPIQYLVRLVAHFPRESHAQKLQLCTLSILILQGICFYSYVLAPQLEVMITATVQKHQRKSLETVSITKAGFIFSNDKPQQIRKNGALQ